jgi:hypothetical protein
MSHLALVAHRNTSGLPLVWVAVIALLLGLNGKIGHLPLLPSQIESFEQFIITETRIAQIEA